ncbi:bifunctional pantoate--beta-alanine ligase/(d)CMP kinase [Leptolyngbya cf. ectocarpi LEGE 11479]|uniref:Bifunctional pantoate ligase/cytidylate kinase n=1 Tax=Leptolyngbya cf. ectocarpi LEGE 11479 TaxID=1828722 RepID=A0A928ZT17_LEPEC|nr:bifunctional pantoate--beta-alanine ligase/(d)CMP kinase [Leptolyngbya ectocarpi]MBE9067212.1 bifunctional pantoate--beta-alanine ligase/(d)CMP kinase [Leptolyngbya cf. ectocarpi LEGE 11479]
MRLLKTVEGLRCWLEQQSGSMGLVPTMGALHEGHLSLIHRARRDNDLVVVSIFVNPLQFGPSEDLDAYPRTLDSDASLCKAAGVDCIFAPTPGALYGPNFQDATQLFSVVPPSTLTQQLCGPFRPGHFQGVATVVTKLLSLVRPRRSYFGQKDAQQLAIIRRLVHDLNLPGAVIGCPIVREVDGLALSSRNKYLSAQERQQAVILYRGLRSAKYTFKATGVRSQHSLARIVFEYLETAPDVVPQYVELVNPYTLEPLEKIETVGMLAVAALVGTTRLIDNVVLRARKPIIAIDGPAGAGKSTVARQLAHQLGLLYLDTGAMYRAFTWYVLSQGCDPKDTVAVADLLPKCTIKLVATTSASDPQPPDVWVNGTAVTQVIRTPEVTAQVSTIAAQGAVRQALVKQQMQYGLAGGVVADGRDIGTHVFPDAELKIFLTASVEERARRRQRDLANQSQPIPELTDLARAISERDHKDSTRAISPLRKADDAIEVVTDSLTVEHVLDKLMALYSENVVTEDE